MTILFVGNQMDDFSGTNGIDDAAATLSARDTLYSTSAVRVAVDNDTALSMVGRLSAISTGDFWLHCRYRTPASFGTVGAVHGHLFSIIDTADRVLCRLDIISGTYGIQVFGDVTSNGAYFSLTVATVYTFDLKVVVIPASITVELYSSGVLIHSVTAANTTGAKTQPAAFMFDINDVASTAGFIHISEVIATGGGESTIGWRLATLLPAAVGTDTAWLGDFNDLANGQDGSFISSPTVGQRESWTVGAYGGPVSPSSIRAVVSKTMPTKGATGPQQISSYLRIGAVNYDGAAFTPNGSLPNMTIWDNNPATLAAWATGALTGIQAGVLSVT